MTIHFPYAHVDAWYRLTWGSTQPQPFQWIKVRDQAIRLLFTAGNSFAEIASEVGVSTTTVRNSLVRTQAYKVGLDSPQTLQRHLRDLEIRARVDAGESRQALAAEYGIDSTTLTIALQRVRLVAQEEGIPSDCSTLAMFCLVTGLSLDDARSEIESGRLSTVRINDGYSTKTTISAAAFTAWVNSLPPAEMAKFAGKLARRAGRLLDQLHAARFTITAEWDARGFDYLPPLARTGLAQGAEQKQNVAQ